MINNIFVKSGLPRLLASTLSIPRNYCSTLRIIRQSDSISQSEIDSILGNDPIPIASTPTTKAAQDIVERELFYNLVPIKNQHFPPCLDPDFVDLLQTPNRNIMAAIGMTVDSSFEDYCKGLQTFWREDELYGQISPPSSIIPETLQFNQLLTTDSPYLERLRKQFLVNLSIPGSIEAEDPRNFMQLRPVEQFRHTPIIPISDSTMKKHKEKLAEYHRRQMVFQVSKQSIFNFFLFCGAVGVCAYMVYLILQKEEERTVAYTRLKYNRQMGIQQAPTFRI